MRNFIILLLILLVPFSTAINLRDYFVSVQQGTRVPFVVPKASIQADAPTLSTRPRPAQFRPGKQYHGDQNSVQNDLHRMILQRIKYPYKTIPQEEVEWVRENRETIYSPFQKRTIWVYRLNDEEIRRLIIRPDVRRFIELEPLPVFKPTI